MTLPRRRSVLPFSAPTLFALALALLPSSTVAQGVSVRAEDGNQHKAKQIFVGPHAVKKIGMLAFQWDLDVQQIRKDFENVSSVGFGMKKVTWGTQVSEVQLSPVILQAMTDQMYDDLSAAIAERRPVVGIEEIQKVPSYQQVGKAVPTLTAEKAWASKDWTVGARGSRSLGALATGIKMTQDDKLGSALTAECGCNALVYVTVRGFMGQKGKAKVDGVPGTWVELGTLLSTNVLVGFDQYAAAAEAQGKKVLRFNKSNHVVVLQSKVDNMKLFVPGGSAKELAGVTGEQAAAVFQKYFIEPMMTFSKSYARQAAAQIAESYPSPQ